MQPLGGLAGLGCCAGEAASDCRPASPPLFVPRSMCDLVALNPDGLAGLSPGATPALPCYSDSYNSMLDMAAGYYGGDVAVGAFAGGNQAALDGLDGVAGAMAAHRVTASLPNQCVAAAAAWRCPACCAHVMLRPWRPRTAPRAACRQCLNPCPCWDTPPLAG